MIERNWLKESKKPAGMIEIIWYISARYDKMKVTENELAGGTGMRENKRIWQKFLWTVSFILIGGWGLLACSRGETSGLAEEETTGKEPDFSYEEEENAAPIYIDQYGYERQGKKLLFIKGSVAQKKFEIRDEQTNRPVFSGTLKRLKSRDMQDLYMGDFSGLEREGSYYVYHDTLGKSYSFKIDNGLYMQMYDKYFKILKENMPSTVSNKVDCLGNVLLAKELFPDHYTEDSFLKDQVKMIISQLEKTDAIKRNGLFMSNVELGKAAGFLSQYAYVCQKDCPELARQCVADSEKAYKCLEKQPDALPDDIWYYVSASLFRITGSCKYREKIQEYDEKEQSESMKTLYDYSLLADFVYLLTPRKTDYDRCDSIFKSYLDQALEVSMGAERENFYVAENIRGLTREEILRQLMVLGIANQSLSSREYEGVQKNYMHYLAGRNPENINYFAGGQWIRENDSNNISRMLFIIASICE